MTGFNYKFFRLFMKYLMKTNKMLRLKKNLTDENSWRVIKKLNIKFAWVCQKILKFLLTGLMKLHFTFISIKFVEPGIICFICKSTYIVFFYTPKTRSFMSGVHKHFQRIISWKILANNKPKLSNPKILAKTFLLVYKNPFGCKFFYW